MSSRRTSLFMRTAEKFKFSQNTADCNASEVQIIVMAQNCFAPTCLLHLPEISRI